MVLDIGSLARPKRSELPIGDIGLSNGLLLVYNPEDTSKFLDIRYANGMAGQCGVWKSEGRDYMLVMGSMDDTERFNKLLHVSISRRSRHPSWHEITLIKQAFYGPERDAMMVLPRDEDWVNLHEVCFHLWETPTAWGIG